MVKLGVYCFSRATKNNESDNIWRVSAQKHILEVQARQAKFDADRSRGVVLELHQKIYNIGHFAWLCVVRSNLTRKSIAWVCTYVPNVAQSGDGGGYRIPQR